MGEGINGVVLALMELLPFSDLRLETIRTVNKVRSRITETESIDLDDPWMPWVLHAFIPLVHYQLIKLVCHGT